MWRVLLVGITGCGRIGFGLLAATGDGNPGDGDAMRDADLGDSNLPAGLVAWFQMDGVMPHDILSTAQGRCAAPNCPTLTAGYVGSGLLFDGANDCLDVGDYPTLHQPAITVAYRAHMTTGAQDAGAISKIFHDVAGDQDTWELGPGLTNDLELTTLQNMLTEQIVTPDNLLLVGQWQHIAYTWDGAMKRVYIDGAQQIFGPSAGPLTYDTTDLFIGCDYNGGPVRFFSGVLDELQIYNRALLPTEIQTLAAM